MQPQFAELACAEKVVDQELTMHGMSPNPEARKVLDAAYEVARQLQHNWIGSEHLLMGLTTVETTIAAQCLRKFGVDFSTAQREALHVIDGKPATKNGDA